MWMLLSEFNRLLFKIPEHPSLRLSPWFFSAAWRPSWCSGWPCASVGHGLWTGATSRPVNKVPSASECKKENNTFTYLKMVCTKKTLIITDDNGCYYTLNRRQRALKPSESPYRALLETMELTNTKLTLQLINDKNKVNKTKRSEQRDSYGPWFFFLLIDFLGLDELLNSFSPDSLNKYVVRPVLRSASLLEKKISETLILKLKFFKTST